MEHGNGILSALFAVAIIALSVLGGLYGYQHFFGEEETEQTPIEYLEDTKEVAENYQQSSLEDTEFADQLQY